MRQRLLLRGLLLVLMFTSVSFVGAQEDRLQVAASHNILGDVVAVVAGDAAEVTMLMPRGADPHSFVPTPRDIAGLADADVVFVNGALFEEGLLEAIENAAPDMNLVTVSTCVPILAFGGHDHDHEGDDHDHEGDDHDHEGDDHDHEGDDHDHEGEGGMNDIAAMCEAHYAEMAALHGHDHDHEGDDHDHSHAEPLGPLYALDCGDGHSYEEGDDHDHEEGAEHAHDHGVCDPHVWMEPHNVMYWTMHIRDILITLDPANADIYTANAAAYLETLDALAHDFIMPMIETVPEEDRILVTNHEAYGYFAARYGFDIVGTVLGGGTTVADPSAADLATVIDTVRATGVPAIFAETTFSDDLAQQIAEETGAQVYVLYSGSLSEANGPASTYLDFMRYNVTTIVEALGGGM